LRIEDSLQLAAGSFNPSGAKTDHEKTAIQRADNTVCYFRDGCGQACVLELLKSSEGEQDEKSATLLH